ncbi:sulfatase-like hydrolase/transferase [Devosia sp. PTR5]|uniref:Sulfatase-like hydrolase/transferase n=1 Tax=Devosia oryzisoli TaxID=2774138 RepID=A0A927FVM8_9HYPH|nr:sulfatase-like hydrolase/transferase [Devosia oryzisoli]MBD8065984.1 sulfatase-like hydrolase/transferase [Devosia oryzisoli]
MSGKPNVLLICADQWPSQLLGCTGRPDIETPTIDRLASVGTRFSRAYSETPICGPARRALMTGTDARVHGDRTFKPDLPMPPIPTLAGCFRDAGYQTNAVGKMHVFPVRHRIGFDDVKLSDNGRSAIAHDDFDAYLSEQGHAGEEFLHGMSNNEYSWRPWHLDERHHNTNWVTREACKTIKRRDPTSPSLWYVSYVAPHPPLVPLSIYLDLYRHREVLPPLEAKWAAEGQELPYPLAVMRAYYDVLPPHRLADARRAFYALCTHIDHQIRLLIGTLREEQLLNDTIICFISDHGEMLGDYGLYGKRAMYDNSAAVPLIVVDRKGSDRVPLGAVDTRLAGLQDVMPTLLDLAGLDIPASCTGESLVRPARRRHLYCEALEGASAMRMVTDATHKLLWYPTGNAFQLFDIVNDPQELRDLAHDPASAGKLDDLKALLLSELYGSDLDLVQDGELVGSPRPKPPVVDNRALSGQRGLQFPPVKKGNPSAVVAPTAE